MSSSKYLFLIPLILLIPLSSSVSFTVEDGDEFYYKLLTKRGLDPEFAMFVGSDGAMDVDEGKFFGIRVVSTDVNLDNEIQIKIFKSDREISAMNNIFSTSSFILENTWEDWESFMESEQDNLPDSIHEFSFNQNNTHFNFFFNTTLSGSDLLIKTEYIKSNGGLDYYHFNQTQGNGAQTIIEYEQVALTGFLDETSGVKTNDILTYRVMQRIGFVSPDDIILGNSLIRMNEDSLFEVEILTSPEVNDEVLLRLDSGNRISTTTNNLKVLGSYLIYTDWQYWSEITDIENFDSVGTSREITSSLVGDDFQYRLTEENATGDIVYELHYDLTTGKLSYFYLSIQEPDFENVFEFGLVGSFDNATHLPLVGRSLSLEYDFTLISGSGNSSEDIFLSTLGFVLQDPSSTEINYLMTNQSDFGEMEFYYFENEEIDENALGENRFEQSVINIGSLIIHTDPVEWTESLSARQENSRENSAIEFDITEDKLIYEEILIEFGGFIEKRYVYNLDNGILEEMEIKVVKTINGEIVIDHFILELSSLNAVDGGEQFSDGDSAPLSLTLVLVGLFIVSASIRSRYQS